MEGMAYMALRSMDTPHGRQQLRKIGSYSEASRARSYETSYQLLISRREIARAFVIVPLATQITQSNLLEGTE